MIVIVDYGMGNLFSVEKAFERLGQQVHITSQREEIEAATAIILPGVGAFPDAMQYLNKLGLVEPIQHAVKKGTPILGICLGMQLLYDESDEHEVTTGLQLLKGRIQSLRQDCKEQHIKIPHMGWNQLTFEHSLPYEVTASTPYVYFVHSFYATEVVEKEVYAIAEYGGLRIPGVVGRDHIFGMQFHPEKSGELGMGLLQGFLSYVKNKKAKEVGVRRG